MMVRSNGRLRWLLASLAVALGAIGAIGLSRDAGAQSLRSLVGGPMSTARLERLSELYLRAPAEEAQAIDRLHEAYLDRFRAELDPQITELSKSMQLSDPDARQFEELLKRFDRIGTRIAEADNAFFASAAALVAEPRRAGVMRLRDARERQRQLGGIASAAPLMAGNGTSFVDLIDVLARERYAGSVAAEMRPALEAFVASQEQRLGAQARAYASEARASMVAWFEASQRYESLAERGGEEPDDAEAEKATEAEEAAAEFKRATAEAGRGFIKVLRANHAENRAACPQLKDILEPLRYAEFREEVVIRALGASSFAYLGTAVSSMLPDVARRMRKDPLLPHDAGAAIDGAEAAWRTRRTAVLDGFLAMLDETEAPSQIMQYAALAESDDEPEEVRAFAAKCDRARAQLERLDGEFTDQLVAILGARTDAYFVDAAGESADDGEAEPDAAPRYRPKAAELASDDAGPLAHDAVESPASFDPASATAVPRSLVVDALELTGTAADLGLVETVYDAWRKDKWDARVEPLCRAYAALASAAYSFDDGDVRYDAAKFGPMREAGLAVVAAVADAHGALVSDLAGALGRPEDDPAFLLVRLWELERLRGADGSVVMRGDNPSVPGVHRVLLLALAAPEEARAILADRPEAWQELVAEVRAVEAKLVEGSYQLLRLQAEIDARGGGTTEADSRRWAAVSEERTKLVDGLRARLCRRIEEAVAKAFEKAPADRRADFARALQRQTYPDFFEPGAMVEREIDAAAAADGLDEDARARIEAMRAEYLAVVDGLTTRMIEAAQKASAVAGGDWELYTAQMEEVERLRLDRSERGAKVVGELRRILGPERAARIPGLAPPDTRKQPDAFWEPFGSED